MESKKIVDMRYTYLEQVTKYREEYRSSVYLDETWYGTHDTVKKRWTDGSTMPVNKGSRLIIVNCGDNEEWAQ